MRYRVECPNCGATAHETEHHDIDCPKCGFFDPAPKKCDTTCPTCGLYWTREDNETCPRCHINALESSLASRSRELADASSYWVEVLPGLRTRPIFTKQEYNTIIDCLSAVKMIGETSSSFVERRGARAIIPNSDYHVGIIDKLTSNSDFPQREEES